MNTLGTIVLLAKLLVSQELRVHSFGRNVLGTLLFLDTIGVSLVGVVMGTRVLGLFVVRESLTGEKRRVRL